jgi:hypothetical protein
VTSRPSATPSSASFEAHYRSLIVGSLQRSVVSETELQRALGHRLRARRAQRTASELEAVFAAGAWNQAVAIGRALRLKRATRAVWVASILLLVAVVRIAGVRSLWTGAADLALILVTVTWFLVDSRQQLDDPPAGPGGAEADDARGHVAAPAQPTG